MAVHQVGVGLGVLGELRERLVDLGLVALGLPRLDARQGGLLGLGVGGHDRGVEVGGQRRRLGGLVDVDADDLLLAGLDRGPAGRRAR